MTLTVSLSDDMTSSLKQVAKHLDRSQSYIVKQALKAYLEEQLWEMSEAKIADERAEDPNAKYLTTEEFFELLEKERAKTNNNEI